MHCIGLVTNPTGQPFGTQHNASRSDHEVNSPSTAFCLTRFTHGLGSRLSVSRQASTFRFASRFRRVTSKPPRLHFKVHLQLSMISNNLHLNCVAVKCQKRAPSEAHTRDIGYNDHLADANKNGPDHENPARQSCPDCSFIAGIVRTVGIYGPHVFSDRLHPAHYVHVLGRYSRDADASPYYCAAEDVCSPSAARF